MSEATLWEQVKEAILALGGKATYAEIVDYVVENNPGTARRNVLTGIFACTVNHHARIHYMAREEGVADQAYDFLFQPGSRPGLSNGTTRKDMGLGETREGRTAGSRSSSSNRGKPPLKQRRGGP